MMTNTLIDRLPKTRGRYTIKAELHHKVWFRVGGPAEVLYKPADVDDLSFFLCHVPDDIPVTVIGVGSNILIRDQGIPGVVIRLGRGFNNIFIHNNQIDVGAALLDHSVTMMACQEGLAGLEFLAGIPGTIGGALRMNAGCYGREIKDVLQAAFVLDPRGKLHTLTPDELGLSYRHCGLPDGWIFIGARLQGQSGNAAVIAGHIDQLMKTREQSQPIRARTGGSTFANPTDHSAWRLIDQAGCRGLIRGGAQISTQHCNFMINTGTATAADLELLGEDVQRRVLETSGIDLKWEIRRLGTGYPEHQHHNYAA